MQAYLTMTSELCFLLANWIVKMACDLDDLLFRGVSATLRFASLCSSKFCAIFSLAARCVDKLRTRHEPLTPSTTATCRSRKNKHSKFPQIYIYHSVLTRRHRHINSSASTPPNATKIAEMKGSHHGLEIVGPELLFSIYKCCFLEFVCAR